MGAPQNLVVNETTWHHGYVQPNREALYAFFCSHLPADKPHPNCSHAAEIAVPEFSHEELWVTSTGQVRRQPRRQPLRRRPALFAGLCVALTSSLCGVGLLFSLASALL